MEVATNTRQLFELLQRAETDLSGFKMALAVGGRDAPTKCRRTLYDIFILTFNKFCGRYYPRAFNCPALPYILGARGSVVVEAQCYKPEGRGIASR
jgi:hypothetical protein